MSPKPAHMGTCFGCGHIDKWMPRFNKHILSCSEPLDIKLMHRVLGVVEDDNGCLLVPGRVAPKISVGKRGSDNAWRHLGFTLFGDTPKGMYLCHRCDNRRCLNPTHFYIGTPTDNITDAWRNGKRTFSAEQIRAMADGRISSEKARTASIANGRAAAAKQTGDNHWTHRSDEDMRRWQEAILAGQRKEKESEVMPI